MFTLQHCISPAHQQALRAGRVSWSDDGLSATCGQYRGELQWSENRIGWYTSERGEWSWINTHMGVVPEGVVKQYEAIARDKVEDSLRRLAAETVADVLDNPNYEYKPASIERTLKGESL
tara:strand:- start:491 stop:850 length:360 start_codon:yes stop_codon:yes gene_type:complete